MVKGLVELHGGTIDLASDGPGCGTEFTVRLPVIPAPRPVPTQEGLDFTAHHRVLVIEDNEDAAASLKQVLQLCGHQVQVAADGPTALSLANEERPEVVICDIGLPGMDGYQVARALRADPATRDAYLIALTGYARPDDARRATEAGFDRHLGKPPSIEQLEAMLAEVPPQPRTAG
jgi:two-component system CheB/CheR fusion protein